MPKKSPKSISKYERNENLRIAYKLETDPDKKARILYELLSYFRKTAERMFNRKKSKNLEFEDTFQEVCIYFSEKNVIGKWTPGRLNFVSYINFYISYAMERSIRKFYTSRNMTKKELEESRKPRKPLYPAPPCKKRTVRFLPDSENYSLDYPVEYEENIIGTLVDTVLSTEDIPAEIQSKYTVINIMEATKKTVKSIQFSRKSRSKEIAEFIFVENIGNKLGIDEVRERFGVSRALIYDLCAKIREKLHEAKIKTI